MSRVVSFFVSEISQLWKVWTAYNPERHYMRGPGPKWREKHGMRASPRCGSTAWTGSFHRADSAGRRRSGQHPLPDDLLRQFRARAAFAEETRMPNTPEYPRLRVTYALTRFLCVVR